MSELWENTDTPGENPGKYWKNMKPIQSNTKKKHANISLKPIFQS